MKYKISVSEVQSAGPFDIYTLRPQDSLFTLLISNVAKTILVKGEYYEIPDDASMVKVVNVSACCSAEQVYSIPQAQPRPTVTPTPTKSPIVSVTPTRTPTPTPTV